MSTPVSDTAMIRAIRELFDREAARLPPLDAPIRVVIAGGAAAHYWTGQRVSRDIDAEFALQGTGKKSYVPLEDVIIYQDEQGQEQSIYIDRNYSPSLSLMHEDYVDRIELVPSRLGGGDKFQVFVLAPVDLAISKIARYADVDRIDIESMYDAIDPDEFEHLATEALNTAIGLNPEQVRHNLHDAVARIRALRGDTPGP
ncbi:DUF6036 family nucleotidyltransferase [Pseudoxanthomonas kaohsiungensis]|uniref:DUF6036 family nucleotidyltransferase n=1 Tax=Pseudoxanthomonas kaohsiungensis TaxID=283923 RepID=A0ABW3LX82_9GAMM|nr:DUF6036 family nucleotidyltransferase [Pseudoxanthomonas kaohsiungensis]KAF1702998.1 hypothetical protein CSC66_09500 [Pseudoxanthomonas kaohsiungensis]